MHSFLNLRESSSIWRSISCERICAERSCDDTQFPIVGGRSNQQQEQKRKRGRAGGTRKRVAGGLRAGARGGRAGRLRGAAGVRGGAGSGGVRRRGVQQRGRPRAGGGGRAGGRCGAWATGACGAASPGWCARAAVVLSRCAGGGGGGGEQGRRAQGEGRWQADNSAADTGESSVRGQMATRRGPSPSPPPVLPSLVLRHRSVTRRYSALRHAPASRRRAPALRFLAARLSRTPRARPRSRPAPSPAAAHDELAVLVVAGRTQRPAAVRRRRGSGRTRSPYEH